MNSPKRRTHVSNGNKSSPSELPSEDHEQMLFVQWFRRTYPGVLIYAIPNGGARHPAVAAKMKAAGTVKGVPDLHVPAWSLWIEMKRQKGGTVSPEQKDQMAYLQSIGHTCLVCAGNEIAQQMTRAFVAQREGVD